MNPHPSKTPVPRLLVISPVFNEAHHLGVVAASIAGQTLRPERWIVVDDGSTDQTPELLRRLRTELSFLRAIALSRSPRQLTASEEAQYVSAGG